MLNPFFADQFPKGCRTSFSIISNPFLIRKWRIFSFVRETGRGGGGGGGRLGWEGFGCLLYGFGELALNIGFGGRLAAYVLESKGLVGAGATKTAGRFSGHTSSIYHVFPLH